MPRTHQVSLPRSTAPRRRTPSTHSAAGARNNYSNALSHLRCSLARLSMGDACWWILAIGVNFDVIPEVSKTYPDQKNIQPLEFSVLYLR
ncbi:hypothetical protein BOSEA31B_13407 [Hyphomicrobiales bacterium]|nr:hypothetical protein BOSEA31B_13407 [Hyphomicrobiales bacterium]CAH1699177.1 hypothetical protein BOSEA1005_12230 [Hyphomicrobiales bacterium]CAI0342963.1 hypothetical protein BO1005MUT1_210028 [Hyphomicrobiales bacterium]